MVFRASLRSVASSFDHPQVNFLLILTRRRRSQVVRQRSAKPSSRVRFPPSPQFRANREILKTTGRGSLDLCRAIGGFDRELRDRGPLRVFRVALRSEEVMTAKDGSKASAER